MSFTTVVTSQNLSNLRSKKILLLNDSIQLDSLSIVPGSEIILTSKNSIIDKNNYNINYVKSILVLSKGVIKSNRVLQISYRVFPTNFSEGFYSRKKENTIITGPVLAIPKKSKKQNSTTFFTDNQIDKRGSISRGITVGNNQDAVINSNLNVQLAGNLSNNVKILAAISDENIPIQPDGNSQQIQDFDKVFIQLYNDKTKLIAGDFEISKPTGYFLNVNKKAQGGLLNTKIQSKKNESVSLNTTISGAISKGKYCRKSFQGQEGNQGPYKLSGCENEQYIIVLAGTEKVYINGKIKNRGKEYDYTIDYNTGELTFTANQPITKDSRIVIEFEYSERSYSRFLIYSANELKTEKGKFWLNVFSEQDSKNQPINQDLTDEQKLLLLNSGDNIENAFVQNVDSVEFRNDYVLYEKQDTIVGTNTYTIFKYSTNPAKAIYQVGYSFVGENKGNYTQTQNAANGKVFKWIAPINNIPQGNYEPVRLLVSPKKQQILNFGGDFHINKRTKSFFEIAVSNNDINTFSTKDASDNIGYALKLNVEKDIPAKDTIKNLFKSRVAYQYIDKNFTTPEKYRSIEFERDWNLNTPLLSNEHLTQLEFNYRHKNSIYTNYNFNYLNRKDTYDGYKNDLNININKSGYDLLFNSSLLNTQSTNYNTEFIRYLTNLSKSLKKIEFGIENELEQNKWLNNSNDSLSLNSFKFSSFKFYLQNSDSTINQFSLSYTLRDDYLVGNNKLDHATKAEDFSLGFGFLKNPKSILNAKLNYRKLEVLDTNLLQQNDENTITGRIDYTLKIFKGAISSSTYYEAGSGLEPKREFSYLKVSNGQGVYSWTDYNDNSITELDEFDVAKFQDQANYIRIYTPGTDYIKTYQHEFSQILNIRPHSVWKSKNGLKNFLSKFSNSLAYFISQKSTNDNYEESLNPFHSLENDSSVINLNQNIRNTFSYNKTNMKFGVDYIYQNNNSKLLLSNGFDERKKLLNGIKLRWNFFSDFTILNYTEQGIKRYSSQFFSNKNYKIENISDEIKFQFQPGFKTKLEVNYKFNKKQNTVNSEISDIHKIGTEISYSLNNKGNILIKGDYLNINYNADINTSVAYEMLNGLKPGNNATWNIIFQKKLAGNIELSFNYNGRVSENIKTIHTGSLQIRAFF